MVPQIKKILLGNSKGNSYVGASLVMFGLLFAIMILGLTYSMWMCQFNVSESVDLSMTTTLKAMETRGYLDATLKDSLENELKKQGFDNYSVNGTTSKPGYGDEISITVSGKIDMANNTGFSAVIKAMRSIGISDVGYIEFKNRKMEGTCKC